MKHNIKKLPHSVFEVEVELDHKEFLDYWQPVYDAALASVHIKGFRPGTAPKELADKAVDKEKIFQEAVKDAVKENLKRVSEENSWELVDQPKIEVLESPEGLKYKATLIVFPEIKLGDYKKICKKVFAEKKEIAVDEKEIKKSIDYVVNSRAKLVREARPAAKGDVVDLEFEGFLDGKSLDEAKSKGDQFVLGEGKFIPGFEENISGHKEGDSFEFTVKFPADYWKKDLQGKDIVFKVKLSGVFKRELPELNDELVKSFGKFSGVEDFKKNIADGLKKEEEGKEKERLRIKALDELVKKAEIDVPEIMVEKTLNGMVEEYKSYSGPGKTEQELKEKLKDSARLNVLNNLIIYKIAKDEGLEPGEKEVEAEANHYLSHSHFSEKNKIDPRRLYDYIYGIVRNKKVFEFLENLK